MALVFGLISPILPIKNLSVNRDGLPPADECRAEGKQSDIAGFSLFEAHQQFAEPVEPRVSSFHNPAARFMFWIAELFFAFLGAGFQIQPVVLLAAGDQHRISHVSGVYTEGFPGLLSTLGSSVDDTVQGLF